MNKIKSRERHVAAFHQGHHLHNIIRLDSIATRGHFAIPSSETMTLTRTSLCRSRRKSCIMIRYSCITKIMYHRKSYIVSWYSCIAKNCAPRVGIHASQKNTMHHKNIIMHCKKSYCKLLFMHREKLCAWVNIHELGKIMHCELIFMHHKDLGIARR